MNYLNLLASGTGNGTKQSLTLVVIYIVFFGLIIYFMMIRPQKKQETKMKTMLSSLKEGDSVLTTAGFYGVVIAIDEDTVIVEFGNNKNCRIPMQKSAIVEVEHADGEEVIVEEKSEKKTLYKK